MPSSTSLLEAELEPGVQGPCEPRDTLVGPMPCPGSHVALRGAVLDLQPLGEATGAGSAAEEVDTVALLTQAPLPAFASVVLPGMDSSDGVMMVPAAYGEVGFEMEVSALGRRKSVNSTECVAVPSSEHVAEIVGRQGCKIKALRAKTNTYIKTPVRGEQPVFVVTGRKEDVAVAKREILSAAEHFSLIRASRNKPGTLCGSGLGPGNSPVLPGQTTIQVRVPYRVVGLVVGPKGATIKRIQQQTHTYIVTPSRDKEPVFEVTGMPENVDRAREEIEAHIAVRTGSCAEACADNNDFHCNGTDVSFEGDAAAGSGGRGGPTASSAYRSSSSCSSSESFYSGAGGRVSDYSPTSPFGGSGFWFGENVLSLGSDDLELPAFEALTVAVPPIAGHQVLWGPFEQGLPLLEGRCPGLCHDSQPSTPRLSPTFHETLELPGSVHACSEPMSARCPRFPVSGMAFSSSSSGDSTTSSSPPDSAGPVSSYRRGQDCVHCLESDTVAALVPCGHNFFCMECANRICQAEEPVCPMCQMPVTQALHLRDV